MTNLLPQLQATDHWQQRYKLLLQAGKFSCEQDIRQPENKVTACAAGTWLKATQTTPNFYFLVDSDSALIKALGLLLCQWVNGKTAEDISTMQLEPMLESLGLSDHLSPSRANGVRAIWQHLQMQV